jgi:hypothetical protein
MAITNISVDVNLPGTSAPEFTLNIVDDSGASTSVPIGAEPMLQTLISSATKAQMRADAAIAAAP